MNVHKQARTEFYRRLAELADRPSRPTASHGIAWPSGDPDRPRCFHSVVVLAYIGDFDQPDRRSTTSWTLVGPPIPRIHVDHAMAMLSRAQQQRWSGHRTCDGLWRMADRPLELTVATHELADFAGWVHSWTQAADLGDPSLIPDPPHRLEHDRSQYQLLTTAYEWTAAAAEQYDRRRPG